MDEMTASFTWDRRFSTNERGNTNKKEKPSDRTEHEL